jgi:hypothetical protein
VELAKGFGFFQSKPATAFSPVAVTPDELGDAWDGAKVHLPITVYINGGPFGDPDAGVDMTFDFGQLIAHAARTRALVAGSIVGSGTISNVDRSHGSACIAEKRVLETLAGGKPITPFLRFGDRVRIEMRDTEGNSIFGAIDQELRVVIAPRWTHLEDFSEGLAAAEVDGVWGYLTHNGEWAIPPRFQRPARPFMPGGIAAVGEPKVYIDRTGHVVWPR